MAPETVAATGTLEDSWVRDSSLAATPLPGQGSPRPTPGETWTDKVAGGGKRQQVIYSQQGTQAGTAIASQDIMREFGGSW